MSEKSLQAVFSLLPPDIMPTHIYKWQQYVWFAFENQDGIQGVHGEFLFMQQ